MGFAETRAVISTTMTVELPQTLKRPAAGNAAYRAVVMIRNGRGEMEAPDSGTIYMRLLIPAGTSLDSRLFTDNAMTGAMANSTNGTFASGSGWRQQATALSDGRFEFFIQVQTGDTEQELTLELGWVENAAVNYGARRFRVGDAADYDTIDTNVADVQTRLGTGTDVAVAPGSAGSVQAHLREVQEQADTIQTEANKIGTVVNTGGTATLAALLGDGANSPLFTRIGAIAELVSLVGMIGKGDDAAGSAGTAGQSLHSKQRKILDLLGTILNTGGTAALGAVLGDFANSTLVARLGAGDDAAVAAGSVGSIHAHIRDGQAGIDLMEADLGDFSAGTNLQSLKALIGTLCDTANVPISDLLGLTVALYSVSASPAPTSSSFSLTAISGGPTVPAADDFYNGAFFVVLKGTGTKGNRGRITDYALTNGVVTYPASFTLAANDVVAIFSGTTGYLGAATDTAAASDSVAGDSLFAHLRRLSATKVGNPADAAVDPDGGTGSLFAWIKHLGTLLDTIDTQAGVQKGSFTQNLVNANAVMSANPTDAEVNATGTATDPGATPPYEIMHIITIALPETTQGAIKRVYGTLKWTGQITTGTGGGNSKWMMSPASQAENVGSAPSGGAVDITDAIAETTSKVTHQRSGLAPSGAIPATNGVKLLLVGKCSVAAEVLTGTVFESSEVEVTYERT